MDKIDKDKNNTSKSFFKYYWTKRSLEFVNQMDKEAAWNKLQRKIHGRKIYRVVRTSSAAVVLLALSFSIFLQIDKMKSSSTEEIYTFPQKVEHAAILILDDGAHINLGTDIDEIKQANADSTLQISNSAKEQTLVYTAPKIKPAEIKYNTLIVPRGNMYNLQLSDGTRIWLNSDTKLSYPAAFADTSREVELQGEAYFEVAKDKNRPFIVKMGSRKVEVLGTSFNISAYEGQPVYTTLESGSVRVTNELNQVVLKPAQQAVMLDKRPVEVREVQTHLFTSWRTGKYYFRNVGLDEIIEQLSRWYNVQFHFTDEALKMKYITGALYKNEELNFSIQIIERVANVRFVKKDDIIYIEPVK